MLRYWTSKKYSQGIIIITIGHAYHFLTERQLAVAAKEFSNSVQHLHLLVFLAMYDLL
jgi:hypothetical protein